MHDRRRLERGQLHDPYPGPADRSHRGRHRHPRVHDDRAAAPGRAVRGVLVPGDPGTGGPDAGALQEREELLVQRTDHRPDVLRLVARGDPGQLGHPDRGNGLDHNVVGRHVPLALDRPEPRLDLGQPRRRGRHRLRQLRPAQPQHPAQLLRAHPLVQDVPHLLEREAEVLERDDPVEPGELGGAVEAVAGGGVGAVRAQQPDGVVVTQHPARHPPVPGEVSDGEHDGSHCTASHGVKVKAYGPRAPETGRSPVPPPKRGSGAPWVLLCTAAIGRPGQLGRGDVLSLRTLGSLSDVEVHDLVLLEGAEPGRVDRGVVNEDIRAAAVLGDEAEALFSVEPLDGSGSHKPSLGQRVALLQNLQTSLKTTKACGLHAPQALYCKGNQTATCERA
ncbi:protein of unknown function [Streptomyces sp. KY75]|nr:protein of unknown function [Streptomyces sp. KY70]CAD5980980.1 protein of unknown function [Streptomyces sp. KY75]